MATSTGLHGLNARKRDLFLHEYSRVASVVQQVAVLRRFGGIHLWWAVFSYPVCKADSVFGSDFREEPKSLMRSAGQSSWRWRGWSPHWGQIIMPRDVAVDGQIIMILRFLFHNIAKGTVFSA